MNKSIFFTALVAVSVIAAPVAAQERGLFGIDMRVVRESAPKCVYRQTMRSWANEYDQFNRDGVNIGTVWRAANCNQNPSPVAQAPARVPSMQIALARWRYDGPAVAGCNANGLMVAISPTGNQLITQRRCIVDNNS